MDDNETLELVWRLLMKKLGRFGLHQGGFPGDGILIQRIVDRYCGSRAIPALMDEAPLMAHH
ncbi:hypothetical protein FEI13_12760 [Halomonas urmiana]|uniref:Uncharacterized protein n=1 Tax=Halomonas urmiana TaxID=490901 RepID=A0A5R8MET6_9GAMM|nr:hypothetical protein [Halomonas urmiana]TLF48588.1 hypothetical protein FEI13_12760 [Halomonas urmiana]